MELVAATARTRDVAESSRAGHCEAAVGFPSASSRGGLGMTSATSDLLFGQSAQDFQRLLVSPCRKGLGGLRQIPLPSPCKACVVSLRA